MARLRYLQNARTGTAGTISKADFPLQFWDDDTYIYASESGVLHIVASTSITLDAPTVNVDVTASSAFVDPVTIKFNCTATKPSDLTITSDSSSTSGSVVIKPLYVDATMSATGGLGRAIEGKLTVSGKLGSYGNAIKGYTDLTGGTGTSGLVSAICAEMKMPASTALGTHAVLEIELVMPASAVIQQGIGANCTSFIRARVSDNVAAVQSFNDYGYFLDLQGLTTGSTDLFDGCTLKCAIGSTKYYLLMSTATASFTTAYPIVASVTTTSVSAYTGIHNTVTCGVAHTGNVAGIRSYVTTDDGGDTLANMFGIMCKASLIGDNDRVSGMMTGLLCQIDLGTSIQGSAWGLCIDHNITGARNHAPIAFMRLVDRDFTTAPTLYLFDLGGTANAFPTGTSGDIHYHDTLHLRINSADAWIPLSTAEGTYTTAYPVVLTNVLALDIQSTIVTAWAYPFSVKAAFATSVSEHGYAAGRFRFTLAATTVISGTAQCTAIRASLEIAGGTTTTLSASGIFAAINARYYTDNVNGINASEGIHCALAAQMLAGQYYTLSGGVYCGLAVLDFTHATAVTNNDDGLVAGIFISNQGGTTLPNAIKIGGSVTNFVRFIDDSTVASVSGGTNDGWFRVNIGGYVRYVRTYDAK